MQLHLALTAGFGAGVKRWHKQSLSRLGFPGGPMVKNLPANAGDAADPGSIPGLGRSLGGRNDNPLLYSCLENPMDSRAWLATVQEVTKSLKRLSNNQIEDGLGMLGQRHSVFL